MRESDRLLAEALREAGLEELVARAADGEWNDYFGRHGVPQHHLVETLRRYTGRRRVAANKMIDRVLRGDFNGTDAESDEWLSTPEAQDVMRIVRRDPSSVASLRNVFEQIGVPMPAWMRNDT
jgi:hypothetical protein